VKRNTNGMTLTELLVSTVLMGTVLAVIGELVYMNTYASTKLTNSVDGQVGCSRATRRIAEDIRAAQIIGNIFARDQMTFPDVGNPNDPAASSTPTAGWPGSPWTTIPYALGPQTLILQQPAYYLSLSDFQNPQNPPQDPLTGFPLILLAGSITGGVPSVDTLYVDTVVYQLVKSTVNTGTYELQVARFPGNPNSTNPTLRQPLNPPQTVLTGIIGPINPTDGTGIPCVFQYLTGNGTIPAGMQTIEPISYPTAPPLGVSINLEVQTPPNGVGANIRYVGTHVESYLKCSQHIKLTNQVTNPIP